ncbi:flavin reductase family protein [Streptomyces johnsoniae]|uniref:Flavin reductase family protein n=1 Tax=Streptomyces johnsoniae TaxID=3075532 RepID=A0ABU2RWE8_9ACTN|nr:flavin reductase family protein [Streptomyces sp. DSM 41886]MDT0441055.1 flavin reductase family protein [Streptomyces sp. DSM 41886]
MAVRAGGATKSTPRPKAAERQTAPDEQTPGDPRHTEGFSPQSVDRDTFRALMGSVASGVSVVTTLDGQGEPWGFTCSALCSVSADPPLLLAGVSNRSGTLTAVQDGGRFAVNVLDSQSRDVSDLFASDTRKKFTRVSWEPGEVTGMPLLRLTVAHVECVLDKVVDVGDHSLMIGRIVGGGRETGRLPLTYWRGAYGRLLHPAAWKNGKSVG